MKRFLPIAGFAALLVFAAPAAYAADPAPTGATKPEAPMVLPDRVLGSPNAPVRVDEYVSLTCPHCAEYYNDIMPELEKRYVDTGKVKFILHDFVRDGADLKGGALARCMPEDEFYPFIKILFKNQQSWMFDPNPEKILVSYARLGGLPEDKADACLKDTKLQDALVAELTAVQDKVEATPTFFVSGKNSATQTIKGSMPVDEFAKVFDKFLLAAQH